MVVSKETSHTIRRNPGSIPGSPTSFALSSFLLPTLLLFWLGVEAIWKTLALEFSFSSGVAASSTASNEACMALHLPHYPLDGVS